MGKDMADILADFVAERYDLDQNSVAMSHLSSHEEGLAKYQRQIHQLQRHQSEAIQHKGRAAAFG